MYFFNFLYISKSKRKLMKTIQMNGLFSMSRYFTIMVIGLMGMLFSSDASAQSINDWVGNRNLVSQPVATQRLESAMVQVKDQLAQSGATVDAVSNPGVLSLEDRLDFYRRVYEEIRDNNRETKLAINMVAVAQSNAGVGTPKISQLVQELVALLS
jgi:hypothetical protein